MKRIDRRQVLTGGAAMLLLPGCRTTAGSEASILSAVAIGLRVYIPSPVVTYGLLGFDRCFNGGDKATLTASLDLSVAGSTAFKLGSRKFGPTLEYDLKDASPVPHKPDWYMSLATNAKPIDQGQEQVSNATLNGTWNVPTGASHGVFLMVNGKNPLVTLAPAIDAEITIGIKRDATGTYYKIEAAHDGFPNYDITLNGTSVYRYDCVGKGDPSNLLPPMDVSQSIGWTALR